MQLFIKLLRQFGPAGCAVVLGILVGRALRVSPQPAAPPHKGALTTAASEMPRPSEIERPLENNDATLEAEVARLLGGASSGREQRTAAEVMDSISAASLEKSDLRRFLAIYEAVGELRKDALGEALERAKKENNSIAIRALERRWAEIDPLVAAKALVDGTLAGLGDAFFGAWAKSNPASALQWYAGLENGDIKNNARASILDRIAKMDPEKALDYANQMPAGTDQKLLSSRALTAICAKDPSAAFIAAQRLPEGDSRRTGMDTVLTQIANTNVAEAQRLLAELPPNSITTAGDAIAGKLARENPQSGLNFASALPDGPSRDAAFAGVAREWAGRDVEAAAKWLDTVPKGAARDAAVASFANRTAPRDPEGATLWASTLPPGAQRSAVLSQTISIWQRTSPAAATDWIATAPGLTADERTALSQVQPSRPEFRRGEQSRRQRAGN